MLSTLLLTAAAGFTFTAAQRTYQTFTSVSTSYLNQPVICTTFYGPSWTGSVPTSYSRTSSVSSSLYPEVTSTSTVYVYTTTIATPVTYVSPNVITTTYITVPTTTLVLGSTTSSTIGTMTTTTTLCTAGPAPESTVTEYKGTYTPVPGQDTVLPASFETSDLCSVTAITVLHLHPTVYGETVTSTTARTTASPTLYTPATYTSTLTTYATIVTITSPLAINGHVDLVTKTISTSCAPTPTVTYAAQCAFQNLISEFDEVGLTVGTFNKNFTFAGVADTAKGDPSLCCQLCVDNEGCVASVYWAQSSSCLLGYVGGEDKCPTAFDYYAANYTGLPTKPRLGEIFQTGAGCGGIRYDGIHTK